MGEKSQGRSKRVQDDEPRELLCGGDCDATVQRCANFYIYLDTPTSTQPRGKLPPGTTVEVKGTVLKDNRNKTSLAIFTLDDDGQNMFTFDRSPSKDTLYNHTLYSNMSLRADKEHTLNMLLNDEDKRLWLDYIKYTPTSSATDTPPESSATSDTLPGLTNEPQNSVDHEGISTGLVVGVSVAAVILTVLVVIGLWCDEPA
ncbi:hypothetical protein AAF712_011799 [Marasmius tenuissimus]|uniref:Galectin domain-containing protein n=1 Tax=Marasmius tenuissimus TaxID=585030 RepID=A0ABR2ZL03_9AGAR